MRTPQRGWREDAPGARKALLLAHRALSPSRRAEAEYAKPHVETAFDKMAAQAGKQTARAHDLLGIRPRAVPELTYLSSLTTL